MDTRLIEQSTHSHKDPTIQQGKPCYLGILCNPCSDQERCEAGRASLFPQVNPVDACRGFLTELTPPG